MSAAPETERESQKPDDDLMLRLVETVEGYATQAKADRDAREADQRREKDAIGAVVWALIGAAWLASVQRSAVSYFVTANWGALPVLIPLFGLVAAFAYRAFRLRVFTVSLVYAVAGMAVLTEAYFMLNSHDLFIRTLNVLLIYIGLWYFVGGVTSFNDDEVDFKDINRYVKQRPWVGIVAVVVVAVLSFWYLAAAGSIADLAGTALFLAGVILLVIIYRAGWPRLSRLLSRQHKPPGGP